MRGAAPNQTLSPRWSLHRRVRALCLLIALFGVLVAGSAQVDDFFISVVRLPRSR